MSPAEKLAKQKPKRAPKDKHLSNAPWHCLITQRRKDLGLSLDDVAKAVKISKTALWQIEHGTDPMLTTAKKLADFFEESIESLWSEQLTR